MNSTRALRSRRKQARPSPDDDAAAGRRVQLRQRCQGAFQLFRLAQSRQTEHGRGIRQPTEAAPLHRLLGRTDVFIHNLAPGVSARAGFGSDAFRESHSRLSTVERKFGKTWLSGGGDQHQPDPLVYRGARA